MLRTFNQPVAPLLLLAAIALMPRPATAQSPTCTRRGPDDNYPTNCAGGCQETVASATYVSCSSPGSAPTECASTITACCGAPGACMGHTECGTTYPPSGCLLQNLWCNCSCGGNGCNEVCDGHDNDGNGIVDEGCGPLHTTPGTGVPTGPITPPDPCMGAPESLSYSFSGLTFTAPRYTDVSYGGTDVPMVFRREYVSTEYWSREDHSRLSLGWFNTFDERLFDGANLANAPTQASSTIVHRRFARGRVFTCSQGSCSTNDGSLDALVYVAANGNVAEHWELREAGGTTNWFLYSGASGRGGAVWKRLSKRGQGWTVNYTSGGALDGYIASVTDHLGRQLDFTWQPNGNSAGIETLTGLTDHVSGTSLATFTYSSIATPWPLLVSATSAEGVLAYSYYITPTGGQTSFLSTVTRNGQALYQVTYESQGFVTALTAPDTARAFRNVGDPRNTCSSPSNSIESIDRSAISVGGSCTDSSAGDAWCAQMSGNLSVCDLGTCRPAACMTFGDPVNGSGGDRITALSGNCECSGMQTYSWADAGSEAPRRMQYAIADDGTVTTFAYDSRGRMVARCGNDSDYVVTTTSSSCPVAGYWESWEYGRADYPLLVTKTHERSRLDPAVTHDVTYTFDATYPELTQRVETGLTRNDVTDANVTETQTTTWVNDSLGRVQQATMPAGEVTSYTYGAQAGYGYGLLATEERWVNTSGTTRLITSYGSYAALGAPAAVTLPSTAIFSLGYSYAGMLLTSRTVGSQTTTYTFDSAGRLSEVIEPSGKRTRYTYDNLGRIQYEDLRDSATALAADRIERAYDAAGRVTSVSYKRLDSSGNPGTAIWTLTSGYDFRGAEITRAYGARANVQFGRDSAGMERIVSVLREDADQMTMQYDAFGRDTEFRRYITGSSSGAYLSSYAQASGNANSDSPPTQITDPHGVIRSYVYDDFRRLVRSNSVDYGTLRWGYSSGRLVERRLSNGKRSAYSYDNLGRVTQINHDVDNPSLVGQDYKYLYDNGDGAISCGITGNANCAYRKGRLGIVQIEYAPAAFWNLEYGYAQDGQVAAELWPSSRQTTYEYDTSGRLLRLDFPVQTGDHLRYEYNSTTNDGEDESEISRVVHELTPGTDYLVWARNFQHDAAGQVLQATFVDRADATGPSIDVGYNTDGTEAYWRGYRRSGSTDVSLVSRTYQYWPDGMTKGWSSASQTDPARTFFYDGANRLTCAASVSGASSCPTGSTLLESYTYDVHENRLTKVTPAGTTTYSNPYANNQLFDEYPPGATIWYGYDANTFGGRTYDVHQSVAATNQRNYYYYASGQLRAIDMPRPGASQGTYQNHEFTFLYDHMGRPIYVVDKNLVTSKERRENLYWDVSDKLAERVITPDSTAPTTYAVDLFAPIAQAATGWMQLQYVNGSFSSETRRYILRDPIGLVEAVYSTTGVGVTSTAYTADYQAFGEPHATSGTADPEFRFTGQIAVVGSDVQVWNGSLLTTLRTGLTISDWRAYDARVGQFISAEPMVLRGIDTLHPYSYAMLQPYSLIDPTGLTPHPDFGPDQWKCYHGHIAFCHGNYGACMAYCYDIYDPPGCHKPHIPLLCNCLLVHCQGTINLPMCFSAPGPHLPTPTPVPFP